MLIHPVAPARRPGPVRRALQQAPATSEPGPAPTPRRGRRACRRQPCLRAGPPQADPQRADQRILAGCVAQTAFPSGTGSRDGDAEALGEALSKQRCKSARPSRLVVDMAQSSESRMSRCLNGWMWRALVPHPVCRQWIIDRPAPARTSSSERLVDRRRALLNRGGLRQSDFHDGR